MQIETLSIEELAALRDEVTQMLADKVAAREKEPLAESERVGALVTSIPSTARPKRSPKYQRESPTSTTLGCLIAAVDAYAEQLMGNSDALWSSAVDTKRWWDE